LSFFHERFRNLSDENLLLRIERKESYQKEAVLAAYDILIERGYYLQSPFEETAENIIDEDKVFERKETIEEYHILFKKGKIKLPVFRILIYFIIFTSLLYFSNNSGLKGTLVYRKLHIISDTLFQYGSISYLLYLILFAVIFFDFKGVKKELFNINSSKMFVAIRVFLFTILIVSFLELMNSHSLVIYKIFAENSYRTFISHTVFDIFVAITEELIFKWLLLTQILLRIGNNKENRVIVYIIAGLIFSAAHIPMQLNEEGAIDYGHLLITFVFFYFSSVLYVRHRNLLLVVALHFLVDIPYIYIEGINRAFFFWSLLVIAIYCFNGISNSWLFKSPKKEIQIPFYYIPILGLLPFLSLPFVSRSYIDDYNIGQELYYVKDKEKSEKYVDQALERNPFHLSSLNLKGNLLYDRGEYDDAWEYYDKSISYDSTNISDRDYYGRVRNRGLASKEIRNYEQCVADLTDAIDNGIYSSRIYGYRGASYLELGNYEASLKDYRSSIELSENNMKALYGIGRLFNKLEMYDSSIHYLQRVIDQNQNFIAAYEVLSYTYSALEKYDTALELMNKAIQMGSNSKNRFYMRGYNYFFKEDFYNALKEFEKSIELTPDNPTINKYLGFTYLALNNFEKGCKHLRYSANHGDVEAQDAIIKYCGG